PSTDAQDVIVTGSFDGWSSSTHLAKTPAGFEGTARVPFGTKVAYKYVVDGRWTTADGQPTELDPIGNLNNVYTAPPAP
ncbi:immunoglobulin E-set, partial [Fomitopsis serialis]|uniref:immunoglobulin E-set n=1 Tax=Fomitopsis serialis TaxID=139415 RepID=UPI0020074E33